MKTAGFVKKSIYLAVIGLSTCLSIANAQGEAVNTMTTPATTASTAAPSPFDATNPMTLAMSWLQDAKSAGLAPNYIVMGTMKDGHPSIKMISNGEMTADGYVFKLNERSNTTQEVVASPSGTVLITWGDKLAGGMQKQIKMYGTIAPQGAVESHVLSYQGKQYDYKSRNYLLTPAGVQFGILNFAATAQSGIADYVNFIFANGAWEKKPSQMMGFDITPQ